ncbi:hypothetical protein DFH09DRAFT_1019878 [Mycena vulgaris]|nr:hypothetical protein DFH09DRAFT_1019878 [Mycena vulgaris]
MSSLAAERDRIDEIDAQMLQLVNERRPLQACLEAFRYPVLTLPNEIVSEFFMHLLPVYPLRPKLQAPPKLAQVCRKWRQIAVSTPSLWRAISVVLDQQKLEEQLCLLETWLDRSGSCPLSISLADDGENGVVGLADVNRFLRAIFAHRSRLEYLELSAPIGDSNVHLFQQEMPLLRNLEMLTERFDVEVPTPVFHAAPELHAVTMLHFHIGAVLPWSQLTTLVCQWIDYTGCATVLELAVNLVHCDLAHLDIEHLGSTALAPLQCLESLTVRSARSLTHHIADARCLLSVLTLPALRRLQIPEELLGLDPIQKLASFISRVGCSLQELRVIAPTLPRDTYRAAFSSIPTLLFTAGSDHSGPPSDADADEDEDDEGYSDEPSDGDEDWSDDY